MKSVLALAALAAVAAMPAAAFTARNGVAVDRIGGDRFVVNYSGRSGAPAFWCAAGDYAVRALGLPPATEIYRLSPPPRGSGEGIVFGFDKRRATRTGLIRLAGGRGVSAAHARFLCELEQNRDR